MSRPHNPADDNRPGDNLAGGRPGLKADSIANAIGHAFAAPALPTDLQQRLGQELDSLFESANDPIRAARQGTLSALVQKKYEVVGDSMPAAVERGEISRLRYELHDLAAPAEKRMGMGRRLALAAAAAAVLLACVWSQPGYRWSEVIETVRQQPFVQVAMEEESPSTPPRLVATRRDQAGKRRPTTASYLNMSGEILRQVSGDNGAGTRLLPSARRAESVEADLIVTLLGFAGPELDGQADLAGGASRRRASVSQSWPRSSPEGVLLDVVIHRGEQRVEATLVLDPATKLPLSCELRTTDAPVRRLRFCYSSADVN